MKPTKQKRTTSAPAKANGSKANGAKPKPVKTLSVIPAPREVARPDRATEALARLGVSQMAVDAAAPLTVILKHVYGGMQTVLTAMRLSPDEVITPFLQKYNSIPSKDRENLPIEAIALAAGVEPRQLLGSITVALQAQEINLVKLIAVSNHHRITETRVKCGLLPSGEKDRTALDIATGFLPSPKGNTFVNKTMIFGSGKAVMDAQRADSEDDDTIIDAEPDLDKLFPPANAMQERLIPIRQRLLPVLPKDEDEDED